MMRTEYDKEADAAYIYLKDRIRKGEVARSIEINKNILLDFDSKKRLIGIEILNAAKTLPKVSCLRQIAA